MRLMRKPSIALLAVVLAICALGVGILSAARETGTLTILSPEENSLVGGMVPVTVSFDTGSDLKITHFQVMVDGRLHMTETLDDPSTDGTVTISLVTDRYSSNQHTVTIKMFAGSTPLRTTTLPLYIDNGRTDIVAPLVAILSPRYGATVSDKVEISLSASDNSGHSPVVSLFIDKNLKLIKDHAPYSFLWDTTQYANGEHLIEVRVEDSAGNRNFARSVKVVVNNPMGFTKMRADGVQSRPLTANRPLPKSVLSDPAGEPMMVAKALEGDRYAEIASGQRMLPPPDTERMQAEVVSQDLLETAQPSDRLSGPMAAAIDVSPRLSEPQGRLPASAATMRMAWPAPRMVDSPLKASRLTPSGLKMAMPKRPVPLTLAKLPRTADVSGNLPEVTPGRLSQIHIVRPGENLDGIARSYGISSKVLRRVNSLNRKSLKPGKELFIPPSIQVVFDNRRVNFDVLPRVEKGKPITPFRQIFEHTGGMLYWYPSAKAVRAINDTREIEIRIGQTRTLVNNEPIEMDLAAFIDSGRTMVPLTFVRDSLDVEVRYNPSTGKIILKSQE